MRQRDIRRRSSRRWERSARSLRTTGLALLGGLVLSALVPSVSAGAGTYSVHSCRLPDGGEARTSAWKLFKAHSSGYHDDDDCPNGSLGFGLRASTSHPADDRIYRSLSAPEGTEIEAYSLWRTAWIAPKYALEFSERGARDNRIRRVERCEGSADCHVLGDHEAPLGPVHLVRASGLNGVRRLRLSLGCTIPDGSSSRCPSTDPFPAAIYMLHRADITLVDRHAPKLAEPPSGPLLDGGALVGEQQVWISARDRGSGVYQVLFEVDGEVAGAATIDDNDGRCRRPFNHTRPCKTEAASAVSFDTSELRDGRHRLRLLVTDATGTNAAVWGRTRIRTANRCNPSPRIETRRVRARFAGGGKKRKRVRHRGRRPRVRGRLTTEDGTPLANAEVCVAARNQSARSSLRQIGTTQTNDKGRFFFRLPRGPSRRVHFVSRTPAGAASARVAVRVKAPVKVRPSRRSLRNGERLVLRGKVGKPLPRRGVLVELQSRRSTGWQTFGTTTARRKGRFRFGHTFTRTFGVQRFRLRARVPRQSTYPYATGASKPVKVTVVG